MVTGGSGFIGSAVVDALLREPELSVLNVDIAPPRAPVYMASWQRVDIMDRHDLANTFENFGPTDVIHLAARIDVEGRSLVDYQVNTEGTEHVLECVARTGVERIVVASTQFVCRPGYLPRHDEDFYPHTIYGESKVVVENLTRTYRLPGNWTIVRPTTVWGPGDLQYRRQFYRMLARGLYLHPSGHSAVRSYGYVGNVTHQLIEILKAPTSLINGRVLYLGDRPAPLTDFVDAFSMAIRGRPARRVDRSVLKVIARIGDQLKQLGVSAPLTTPRYRSMVDDYPVPLEPTLEITGQPPFTLDEAVRETVIWLREIGFL
jgi:GlcNAc-P-P-Und epimerase